MHELSIATEIIDIVDKEAARLHIARVGEINLKIGALSGVNPDALLFALEASTIGTPLEKVKVNIETVPVRGSCRACGREFELNEFVFVCSHCGSGDLHITGGEELDIASICAA
jgi:hydrogenase nickel incorporation protein HypA/HybF